MLWLIRAALVVLYPRTEVLPGLEDTALDAYLRRFRREAPALIWLGAFFGALVFHLTPLFTVFVPLPAFLLPRALADRHAHRITQSSLYLVRQSVFLVKLVGGLAWGSDPEVRRRLGLAALPDEPSRWRTS
jgi:hypothetical protein